MSYEKNRMKKVLGLTILMAVIGALLIMSIPLELIDMASKYGWDANIPDKTFIWMCIRGFVGTILVFLSPPFIISEGFGLFPKTPKKYEKYCELLYPDMLNKLNYSEIPKDAWNFVVMRAKDEIDEEIQYCNKHGYKIPYFFANEVWEHYKNIASDKIPDGFKVI